MYGSILASFTCALAEGICTRLTFVAFALECGTGIDDASLVETAEPQALHSMSEKMTCILFAGTKLSPSLSKGITRVFALKSGLLKETELYLQL